MSLAVDHMISNKPFLCQKMLEVNIWISSSQQDNTENHDYVMCQLYAVFMSMSQKSRFFMRIIVIRSKSDENDWHACACRQFIQKWILQVLMGLALPIGANCPRFSTPAPCPVLKLYLPSDVPDSEGCCSWAGLLSPNKAQHNWNYD